MATKAAPKADERPIVIRRVKKVVGGGHHGGAWKVAYADFVTAMMAFFMLLWLLSNPDKNKLKGLAQYFSPSAASGKPGETVDSVTGSTPGLGAQQQRAKAQSSQTRKQATSTSSSSKAASKEAAKGATASVPDSSLRVLAEELRLLLQPASTPQATRQLAALDRDDSGLRISLMDDSDRSMFRAGTAALNPYARTLLQTIARKIARGGVRISIEGHTDASGGNSAGNWKLSAERALAAREAMLQGGLTPDRFRQVVALAATEPVYPDQPLRPENRRITIVLVNEASSLPAEASFRQ